MKRLKLLGTLVCGIGACIQPVWAQTTTATLSGTVTDSTGALVQGASITATNTGNNLVQNATTTTSGVFTIPLLPPGNYKVTATHTGFAPVDVKDVVLQVGDRLALDIVLKVGAMAESITVSADAGQLQLKSESGERSEVITNRQVRDLAMNGRNTLDLMKTLPGVVSSLNGQLNSVSGLGNFNINGTRATEKQFVIDGASNIKAGANNAAHVTMNPDAIAEVKVLTSNFQAEYGKAAGGFIQYTTRSGTTQFHGGGRYFRRHDSLNANNFFNNMRGLPRPLYRYNYYGYDIGGPVLIPGTSFNKDRNKLFFFWNQEFYRQPIVNDATTVRMPTALERNGDFSQTRDGNGNPVFVKDPLSSGACGAAGQGGCFPGNVIPKSRFFSDGQKILNIYPQPNTTAGGQVYNYVSQVSGKMPRREDILRLDYNISARTRFSARMIHNYEDREEPYGNNSFNVVTNFPLSTVGSIYLPWNFSFSLINTISPSMTNEFIFGPSRSPVTGKWSDDKAFRATYGITFPLFIPNKAADIIPTFLYGGIANQSFPSANIHPLTSPNYQDVDNFTDNLTKVIGRHTAKVGVYVQRNTQYTGTGANPHGQINFNNDANNPLNTGHPFANALLGIYSQYSQNSDQILNTVRYINVETYAQDTWKVTRRLTLDYGLRVSWVPPQYEVNRQSSLFVPSLFDPKKAVRLYAPVLVGGQRRAVDPASVPAVPTATNTLPTALIGFIVPGSGDPLNGIAQANKGYPQGGFDSRGAQWGPRIGFALDVTGNGTTVIRGGWGISYDRPQGNVILAQLGNAPFLQNPQLFYGYLADLPNATGLFTPSNFTGYDRPGKLPNVHSASLGVQRNIGFGTVIDVAYVGTFSRHNVQQRNVNGVPYFATFTKAAQDPSMYPNGVVPDVEPGLPDSYRRAGFSFTGARALPVNFLRPYPGYGDINLRDFSGSGNYHSLQVSLNRRLSKKLTFGAVYTWSRTMETGDADFQNNNPYNTRAYDYRIANFDRTHTFVVNYVYDLPKFSRMLSKNRMVRGAVDNWQVSGISQYYSGLPNELGLNIQGINNGQRILGTYSISPLPYRVGGAPQTSASLQVNPDGYYAPAIGDIGPYPRTYLRGPGFLNHDISVFKNFPLVGEGRYLQFRVEMFNALNSTQFAGVNAATQLVTPTGAIGANVFNDYPNVKITNNVRPAGSTAFLGQYFGEYNAARDPRIIQLAVKIYF